MKKRFTAVCMLSLALLSSCGLATPGEYMPLYLQEPSPLDPPGMEALRAEARAKYVKEGLYAPGEELEVQQGKAYLFNRNPDYYEGASGDMVTTAKARIISCEGLYYFVETEEGTRGFLRETDFVSPVKLVSTVETEQPLMAEQGGQKVMTTASGRTVVVVNKKSDKADEFANRLRQLESTPDAAAENDLPTPSAELPEPAGSAGE